jgi:magnesium chelatase subunit I
VIEQIAFEARKSDFIDQKSGVSARLTISAMETLVSNAERRSIVNHDGVVVPRITDLSYVVPSITGKVELVFEGEQEGMEKIARALIGRAVKDTFKKYFPDPLAREKSSQLDRYQEKYADKAAPKKKAEPTEYDAILSWFASGNVVALTDTMPFDDYLKELSRVPRLREFTAQRMKIAEANRFELASAMEFVLDALHQNSKLAKQEAFGKPSVSYTDMIGSIFTHSEEEEEEL